MRRFFRNNGLSLACLSLFLLFLVIQSLTSHREYNEEQREHQEAEVGYVEYLGTGNFKEAVFENWESEFLQMGAYVLLTMFLLQRGSPESKKMDGDEPVDEDPDTSDPNAPWPVRRGGLALRLYQNSLTLALFGLFFMSMFLHALGGAEKYGDEQVAHGEARIGVLEYMTTARFWSESMENWQSEFLAVGSLVVLSIFLRQKGSPESKPVSHPHRETGGS
jgi:heme exporter protein D